MVRSACLTNIRCGRGGTRRVHGAGMMGVSRRVAGLGVVLVCAMVVLSGGALARAAGAEEACPNEQLRIENNSTALPDCRAYEQVTPPFKDGYRFATFELGGLAVVAPSGSQLYSETFATLDGSESNPYFGASYELTRGSSGWETVAVGPPASRFGGSNLDATGEDYEPADGSTLWNLTEAGQIWLRSPAGVFTEVGPSAPPSVVRYNRVEYSGASRGFSHVFFHIIPPSIPGESDFLWPFDETAVGAISSLYEYTGVGNAEPQLVGVKGGAGSHTLISKCGVFLGARNLDVYNAISASGKIVYFTAGQGGAGCTTVNELYARLGSEKTLAISEPALPPGEHCTGLCASAAHKEGIFQGASEDGSKVFFLTEQPLLNGDEDTKMDLYMAELQGEGASATIGRLVQVSHNAVTPAEPAEVQGVARVSEDGSRVYFVARGVLAGPNAETKTPTAGDDNLYVYDTATQQMTFIATLSAEDESVWRAVDNRPVQATPADGRFLLFASMANLTGDASHATRQLYRYDASDGELIRVSIAQPATLHEDGATGTMFTATQPYNGNDRLAPRGLSISADGSYVFFESEAGLTPAAQDEEVIVPAFGSKAKNVYEWEADGAGACQEARGCLSLLSPHDTGSEEGASLVRLIGTDTSGADVFFTTSVSLSPSDTDTSQDIYDARIDGGFPAPAHPAVCEAGDTCQGAVSEPPSKPTAGSLTFSGAGNLAGALTSPPPSPVPAPLKRRTVAQVRAEKLAKALRACRAEHSRHKRSVCESEARKRYGPVSKAKKSAAHANRRTGR